MRAAPAFGAAVARSIVVRLGADCGIASSVAAVLRARQGKLLDAGAFTDAGIPLGASGAVERTLADFANRGWCAREGRMWRAEATPPGLAEFLAGAAAMREFGEQMVRAEPVVTLPHPPSLIAAALLSSGVAQANLVATDDAFNRIARRAVGRLTVMTPFLNDEGLDWALRLLAEAGDGIERHLVVRERQKIGACLAARRSRIAELGIRLYDYWVPSPAGNGFHETFHAKVVLADEHLVYVGSANLTVYALRSVELGALIEGAPVREIAAAMSAIKQISESFVI